MKYFNYFDVVMVTKNNGLPEYDRYLGKVGYVLVAFMAYHKDSFNIKVVVDEHSATIDCQAGELTLLHRYAII